jgi:hypothetical protein
VIGELFVEFAVAFEDFLLAFFQAAQNLLCTIVLLKLAVYHKKIFTVFDILYSQRIEITFTDGQMIHGIQNIRFPNTVFPYEAIDFSVKFEGGISKILVV